MIIQGIWSAVLTLPRTYDPQRIGSLRAQLKDRQRLSDGERATLGEIAHRLARKALDEIANMVKPETLLGSYRKFVAKKFDGSKARKTVGRPRINQAIEGLV